MFFLAGKDGVFYEQMTKVLSHVPSKRAAAVWGRVLDMVETVSWSLEPLNVPGPAGPWGSARGARGARGGRGGVLPYSELPILVRRAEESFVATSALEAELGRRLKETRALTRKEEAAEAAAQADAAAAASELSAAQAGAGGSGSAVPRSSLPRRLAQGAAGRRWRWRWPSRGVAAGAALVVARRPPRTRARGCHPASAACFPPPPRPRRLPGASAPRTPPVSMALIHRSPLLDRRCGLTRLRRFLLMRPSSPSAPLLQLPRGWSIRLCAPSVPLSAPFMTWGRFSRRNVKRERGA
jgi:hypothetical protein